MTSPFPNSFLHQAFKSNAGNAFRLDEGYSEDTRSQAGSEMRADSRMGDVIESPVLQVPQWATSLGEAERSELAYVLLRSLRTSSIAAIVQRLTPLLHIDPVLYLPPEITFEIFSYIDPQTLLLVSTLSKSWRARALDGRLWRLMFEGEGWVADTQGLRRFEAEHRSKGKAPAKGKLRARRSDAVSDTEMKSPKKRAMERQQFGGGGDDVMLSPEPHTDNHALVSSTPRGGTDESDDPSLCRGVAASRSGDTEMKDASSSAASIPPTPLELTPSASELDPPIQPGLLLNGRSEAKVNWQYLYKQRRRLEANWLAGHYRNFQLPHPDHPEEAHAECVYTIQYSSNYLVSGSRDKTLRIWNLKTQRLAVKPLRGHSASVLCLQFDDRPEQDIVVSGGSDCHVILWKFSTGEMIQKLSHAHADSVLNLRFDDRYLTTCSKDKSIKIWNRQALRPTDDTYPLRRGMASAKFPSYILDINNIMETEIGNIKPLKEYSLLSTLEGHNAAVNAIQIFGSQIVSASGDRQIRIWDVRSGQCLKTISGHQKGIACVQFDGRRIVSGSSDETVRIFDRATGAEVACLKGHKHLVRTVQARFGDVPGSELDEEAEARDVDRRFFQAQMNAGSRREPMTRDQRQARNAGSRDPNEIFALGAMLPPGGGGSKWARIVSGSYDETVIIWKRDAEGKWVPAHQLHQFEAVLGAGGQPRQQPGHQVAAPPVPNPFMHTITQFNFQTWLAQHGHMLTPAQIQSLRNQMASNIQLLNQNQTATLPPTQPNFPYAQQGAHNSTPPAGPSSVGAANGSATSTTTNASTVTATPNPQTPGSSNVAGDQSLAQQALQGAVAQQWLNNLPLHTSQVTPGASTSQAGGASNTPTPQPQPENQPPPPPLPVPLPTPQQAQAQTPTTAAIPPVAAAGTQGNAAAQPAPAAAAAHQQQQQPPHAHHHHHHHHMHAPNPIGANSRVFKLQFDSRRIICCSQDPTIVGWDFANGDREIEDACQFFGEEY